MEAEARARGDRFERLDEQTLLRKIAGDEANSPFINSLSWGSAPPGGTVTFIVGIHNPDPVSYSGFSLFGYLFFGAANTVQSTDLSLTAVDTRFPRYWRGLGGCCRRERERDVHGHDTHWHHSGHLLWQLLPGPT
jgi:hypothetical protein